MHFSIFFIDVKLSLIRTPIKKNLFFQQTTKNRLVYHQIFSATFLSFPSLVIWQKSLPLLNLASSLRRQKQKQKEKRISYLPSEQYCRVFFFSFAFDGPCRPANAETYFLWPNVGLKPGSIASPGFCRTHRLDLYLSSKLVRQCN